MRKLSVEIQKTGFIEFTNNALRDPIQVTILQLLFTFRFKTQYLKKNLFYSKF